MAATTCRGDQTKQPPIGEVRRKRAIDLETMTTNLTIRRPFRLPFRQQVFLFDRDEMLGLFPQRVVDTMMAGLPPSAAPAPDDGCGALLLPRPVAPEDGQAQARARRPCPWS